MGNTTVYRVEHRKTLEGPYNAGEANATLYNMAFEHCDEETHPGPFYDGKLDPYSITTEHVFGFESYSALFAWFDGWLCRLDRKGFVLAVYTVPEDEVLFGAKQLVFVRNAARLVAHEPLALRPTRFSRRRP